MAELFPQQEIVEAAGTDEEEELFEDERDDFGVQAVLGEDGVEPGEEPQHPVERLLGVDLLFGIPALTAAVVVGQRLVAGRLVGQLTDPTDALVLQGRWHQDRLNLLFQQLVNALNTTSKVYLCCFLDRKVVK